MSDLIDTPRKVQQCLASHLPSRFNVSLEQVQETTHRVEVAQDGGDSCWLDLTLPQTATTLVEVVREIRRVLKLKL